MNKYQAKGMLIYMVGNAEETVGKMLGNSRRRLKGYQKKMTGKAMMTLGDAREAIRLCIATPLDEMERMAQQPAKPTRLTSKT